MDQQLIVLRLVGGYHEGQWIVVPDQRLAAAMFDGECARAVTMVPTGSVEWRDDDMAAEVYVPEHLLHVWQSEHQVDAQ